MVYRGSWRKCQTIMAMQNQHTDTKLNIFLFWIRWVAQERYLIAQDLVFL